MRKTLTVSLEALNYIMSMLENGTNLYEEFQTYFTTQKELFKSSGDSSYQELTQYFVNLKAQGDSSGTIERPMRNT